MKRLYYTHAQPPVIAFDLHLVSTRWQLKQLQKAGRNEQGIGVRKTIFSLESYAVGLVQGSIVSRAQALYLLRGLLANTPAGRFGTLKDMRGFTEALLGWIYTLLGENIRPQDLTGPQKDLQPVYAAFLETLAARGLDTRETLLGKAVSAAKKKGGLRVLVTGFIDFRALELDFLNALAENNDVTVCLSRYEETPFTQKREKRFREAGWLIDGDVRTQAVQKLPYLTASNEKLLAQTVLQEAVQRMQNGTVDIIVSTQSLQKQLLTEAEEANIPLTQTPVLTAAQTGFGRDFLHRLTLLDRNDDLALQERAKLHSFPMDPEEDRQVWEAEQAAADANLPLFLDDLIAGYQQRLAYSFEDYPAPAMQEWHGAKAVSSALDEWKALQTESDAHLFEFLRDALEEAAVSEPAALQGIRLLSPAESANLPVAQRIFCGFDPDYPKTESDNFLLRGPFAAKGAVLSPVERYFKEKLRIDDAVEHADAVLFALLQTDGIRRASPLVESRLETAALQHRSLRVPHHTAILSHKDAALYKAANDPNAQEPQKHGAFRKNRAHPGAGKGTGGTGSYSPGALEAYVKCPFQYWVDYVLGVETDDTGVLLIRGTVIHAVLAAYFKEQKEAINQQLDAGNLPSVDENRVGVLLAEAAAASTIPPLLLQEMRQQLLDYIELDLVRLHQTPNYRVGEVEIPFFLQIKSGSEKISIAGRIDRLDESTDGAPDWIADYKTGSLPAKTAMQRGESFQLPVYSLSRTPYAHVYYGSIQQTKVQSIQMPETYSLQGARPMKREAWEALLEETKARIVAIDDAIRAGNFRPTPSAQACRYCSYAPVCRKEELS